MTHFALLYRGTTGCGISLHNAGKATTFPDRVTCKNCEIAAELSDELRLDALLFQRLVLMLNTPIRGAVVDTESVRSDIEAAVKALVEKAGGKP